MEKHPQPHVIREQRHCGHLRRTSRPFSRSLRTNSRASSDTSGVQSWTLATTNQSFKLLTSSNNCPGQLRSSKSHQYRWHRAEWPVLQLTKLPKKPKRPWRTVRSHPKVVGFDSSLPHTPDVFPIAEPKRPHLSVPAFKKHHQNSTRRRKKKTREDPQREKKKERKWERRGKKKRAKFWAVRRRWVRHRGSGSLAEGGPADTHTRTKHTTHPHNAHTHKKKKLAKVEVSLS